MFRKHTYPTAISPRTDWHGEDEPREHDGPEGVRHDAGRESLVSEYANRNERRAAVSLDSQFVLNEVGVNEEATTDEPDGR